MFEYELTADSHTRQCAIWTTRLVLAGLAHHPRGPDALDTLDTETRRLVGLQHTPEHSPLTVAALQDRLAALEPDKSARGGALFANVTMLGDSLGLSKLERDLLALAVMMNTTEGVNEIFWQIAPVPWSRVAAILAAVLESTPAEMHAALSPGAPLVATRLVKRGGVRKPQQLLDLPEGFVGLILEEHSDADALVANLFRPAPPPTLTIADFPHVAADLELLVPILKTAYRDGTLGFDVLIHGPQGTDKTELVRVIAHEVGARLCEVNLVDNDGDALSGGKRLAAWALSQGILRHKPGSLLLFEKAEAVFPCDPRARIFGEEPESRVGEGWLNRALETHPVPTVWVSNAIDQLDPAYLRRFDIVVEVGPAPASIRRQMLNRHLSALPLGDSWLDRAANDVRLAPAHVKRAARVVRMLESDCAVTTEAALDRLLEPGLDGSGTRRIGGTMDVGPYDLSLVNASRDVQALGAALAKNPRGTLCLYGPPGTGKTAFVQHLATLTGLPLLQKRGSDLRGKYVGETEKAIAAMFRQARDERRMLFLDEADTFLQDRSTAQRHWEVSFVNELLVQMEAFDGLFVCATNLVDSLDRASLRRFSLKIRFDPLSAVQRWEMLTQLCGKTPEESLRARLDKADGLAAGDFAVVARQEAMLGTQASAEAMVTALEEELAMKSGTARRVAGFAR